LATGWSDGIVPCRQPVRQAGPVRERIIAGFAAARARGKSGGRPKRSPKSAKVTLARKLYADKTNTVEEVCKPSIYPGQRFIDISGNEEISFAE
jgi:hypothetical protein